MSSAESNRVSSTGHTLPNPQGLLEALELMELSFALVRQRLIREHPQDSPEEITERLNQWIRTPRSCCVHEEPLDI
jgi:hypothetical protein